MCKKKSNDKRYRLVLQVAVWNSGCTRVVRYERQTLLVKAKNPTKAVEKAATNATVLKVRLEG